MSKTGNCAEHQNCFILGRSLCKENEFKCEQPCFLSGEDSKCVLSPKQVEV